MEVGRRFTRVAGKSVASVEDTPAHLLDPSHIPQVDGGEGEEEKDKDEDNEEVLVGPKPPTYNELALQPCGCDVCGEEMFWVKTVPCDIYWDHMFICKNKCEPILLQTT